MAPGLMLGQHRRRWPNMKPALGQRVVFAWRRRLGPPSKHKTFVGPITKTLGRRCTNVIQMFCVCWAPTTGGWNDRSDSLLSFMMTS